MNTPDLIRQVRSGIAEIAIEYNRESRANGSAFLFERGLITNSHVIRPETNFDTFRIRFEDLDLPIRISPDDLSTKILTESPESGHDYAVIELDEPEFNDRHRFDLGEFNSLDVGQQILFMGYPFGMPQLTAHMGHISSIFDRSGTSVAQIDGSINGGNSGGPLISIESGKVVGIVTRAVTGLIERQFDELITALDSNAEILKRPSGMVKMGGIDPMNALQVTQTAMARLARDLKRTANVGIGYAYSIDPVREYLDSLG